MLLLNWFINGNFTSKYSNDFIDKVGKCQLFTSKFISVQIRHVMLLLSMAILLPSIVMISLIKYKKVYYLLQNFVIYLILLTMFRIKALMENEKGCPKRNRPYLFCLVNCVFEK